MAYDTQAQEFAFGLYARGWSKERCLREMRKIYAGFSGSTWDEWVKKYDWPARRARLDAKRLEFEDLCRDTNRVLMAELNEIRDRLMEEIRSGRADAQTIYAHASVSKQIAEIARRQAQERDPLRVSMETLNLAFEKFLSGLREIDGLAKPLEANAARVGELVARIGEELGREVGR